MEESSKSDSERLTFLISPPLISSLPKLLIFIVIISNVLVHVNPCSLAQFECSSKQCIQGDKYCNRVFDCKDKSDEPSGCTVCNRTYYGLIGDTYSLTINLPAFCTINFVAAGDTYGDIVQLSIPLSRKNTASNCSKSVEIREIANPHHKSHFCTIPGFQTESMSNYFSDSNRVQILFNSEFDLSYKFLTRKFYPNRGTLLSGTLCSILYENCENNCTVQTPNFPGLYPNNATCYYAIRDPVGSGGGGRGLISLSGSVNIGGGELRVEECGEEYGVVYDGYSIRDPILIKFCGNGHLSEVISSGHEMLVQFYSGDNGLSTFSSTSSIASIRGLNLVARTIVISKDSHAYSENHNCMHTISSFEKMRGRLVSPLHSLPANTTCTYNFQGRSNQRVWISFLKFSLTNGSSIQIWEQMSEDQGSSNKSIGLKTNSSFPAPLYFTSLNTPPICEFKLLTALRACLPFEESIISKSPQLTLVYNTLNGTVLDKSSFIIEYEFIHGSSGDESNCSNVFRANSGSFSSTRNVLLFGRGGKNSLRCVFRFEAERGQQVRIVIKKINIKGNSCKSVIEPITRRTICKTSNSSLLVSKLEFRQVLETTNDSFSMLRDCFCGNELRNSPIILISSSNIVELVTTIENMGAQDDQSTLYYEGTYEILDLNLCTEPITFTQSTVLSLRKPSHCPSSFYLFPPEPHTFLTLKSSSSLCKPLVVHMGGTQKYICLQYEFTTFSPGWLNVSLVAPAENTIVLELLESEISVNYLQVFSPTQPIFNYIRRDTCGGFSCSSIGACVHSSLFCNGVGNCPGGGWSIPEDESSCESVDYTTPVIVGMGISVVVLALYLCCSRSERKGVG